MSDQELHPAVADLEAQLRQLETIADPVSRRIATDLLASVLQFHTVALQQMLEVIQGSEEAAAILGRFDHDPLIRGMLLVHDLHHESFHVRVKKAMDELEPTVQKREAVLELITAGERLVHVKVNAGRHGGRPLGELIEQAIRNAVPEAEQVIVEEAGTSTAAFVPLTELKKAAPAASAATNSHEVLNG
jgi:ATP-dependent Clp protease ATP-binding subunit ClpA